MTLLVAVEVSAAVSGDAVRAMADLSERRRLPVVHVPALHAELLLLEEFDVSSFAGAGAGDGVGAGVSLADSPICLTMTSHGSSTSGTTFLSAAGGAAAAADEIAGLGGVSSTTVLGTVLAVDARSRRSASPPHGADFGSSAEADLASRRSIRRWTDVLSSRGSVAESSVGAAAGSGLPLLPELRRRVASALRVRISPGMREWTVVMRWWVVDGRLATMLRVYSSLGRLALVPFCV